jgi:hypothetical protein
MMSFYPNKPLFLSLSPDLEARALCYAKIQYLGMEFHFAITREMKKLYGLKITNGGSNVEFKKQSDMWLFEKVWRDVISAIYLQVRDSIGAEITKDLRDQLTESIGNAFETILSSKVTEQLVKRLPGDHTT